MRSSDSEDNSASLLALEHVWVNKLEPIGSYLLLLTCLLSAFPLQSEETQYDMVLLSEHLPPNQIVADSRLVDGTSFHQVMPLLDKADITVKYQDFPWARSYDYALKNKNVLIFSLARTTEREPHFHWIKKLSSHKTMFLSRKNTFDEINSAEAAKDYILGVKRNDVVHQYLLSQGFTEGKNLIVVTDSKMTINMLMSGRVDFANAWPELLNQYCAELQCQPEDFQFSFELVDLRQDLWLAASIGTDEHLLDKLRTASKETTNSRE